MQEIKFENLPQAVGELFYKLDKIEQLLNNQINQPETDNLLTIQEAGELLKLTVPTLYGYVHRSEIPYSKSKKRLWFSKQELIEWIKAGRKRTVSEINSQANELLQIKKR